MPMPMLMPIPMPIPMLLLPSASPLPASSETNRAREGRRGPITTCPDLTAIRGLGISPGPAPRHETRGRYSSDKGSRLNLLRNSSRPSSPRESCHHRTPPILSFNRPKASFVLFRHLSSMIRRGEKGRVGRGLETKLSRGEKGRDIVRGAYKQRRIERMVDKSRAGSRMSARLSLSPSLSRGLSRRGAGEGEQGNRYVERKSKSEISVNCKVLRSRDRMVRYTA